MLSPNTLKVIKSVAPAVAANAETITKTFYQRMFRENPEVQEFFNPAHQNSDAQPKALAGAIVAYFSHIDNPGILKSAIELIAQKHCSLQVLPEHYPIVGKHLLAAIKDVFGEAATTEVITAVGEAYQFLADVLINRESTIYADQRDQDGGWNGYRRFRIDRKIPESDSVTSFYLVPTDSKALPKFKPGQYITVRVPPGESFPGALRNYSLSDTPTSPYYRISVKLEDSRVQGKSHGVVSHFLHHKAQVGDTIEVGPPCGEFFVDRSETRDAPIVFIGGGIGVTPLLSMAKSLVKTNSVNSLYFCQASRNGSSHAFTKELRTIEQEHPNAQVRILFDEPMASDQINIDYDFRGRISRGVLADYPTEKAHFYLCGPKEFMFGVQADLAALGVPDHRIHREFFGPLQST